MIVSGIGWFSESGCGSQRLGYQKEFKDTKVLYRLLEDEGIFNASLDKARWFSTGSRRYCFAAALALRDSFEDPGAFRSSAADTGMLSLSRDGSLKANLDYFRDYLQSGRKSARGNLFIHTLPTSPLADISMAFGFKGPLFHLASAEPQLGLLLDRSEALSRRSKELNLLCCISDESSVLCFFLTPQGPDRRPGDLSLSELRKHAGHLGSFREIADALKLRLETFSC